MSIVRSVPGLATLAVVATAACVYDARVPSEPALARAPQLSAMAVSVASSAGVVATGRHIVSFTGAAPANFAAQVAALGGKVVWASPDAGLAAVSGLVGAAPTKLAGMKGIQEVDADAAIPLDIPLIATESAADGGGVASNANPAGAVRFARQWNMLAVQADAAWAHGFLGSSNVSIFMLRSLKLYAWTRSCEAWNCAVALISA